MNHYRLLPLLFLLIWQSGCISIFADRKVYVEEGKTFRGLIHAPQDSVNLFITHGMGTQDSLFEMPVIEGIFAELGEKNPQLLVDTSFLINEAGTIRATYRLYSAPSQQKRYRIFSINWSNFNQDLRDFFIDPSGQGGIDYDDRRNKLIGNLKKDLLTDGVIDLIQYSDPIVQAEMHQAFYNIIARMFLKQPMVPNDSVETHLANRFKRTNLLDYYLITGSLGSKVTFDAFARSLKVIGPPPLANTPKFKIHQYMMSNQLSFLQYLRGVPSVWADSLTIVFPPVDSSFTLNFLARRVDSLELIAFNDPNDLLGFYLPPEIMTRYPKVSVVNVSLRNANGLIANPIKAHDGAKHNPKLQKMITLGSSGLKTKPYARPIPSTVTIPQP